MRGSVDLGVDSKVKQVFGPTPRVDEEPRSVHLLALGPATGGRHGPQVSRTLPMKEGSIPDCSTLSRSSRFVAATRPTT